VLVGDTFSECVAILFNTSTPGAGPIFSAPDFVTVGDNVSGDGAGAVAAVDLNGDGLPDLVLTHSSSAAVSFSINTGLHGSGSPGFAAPTTMALPFTPIALLALDVNTDSKPDLVLSGGASPGHVRVLFNGTSPGAAQAQFPLAADVPLPNAAAGTLAATDYNGDGKRDLLVVESIADAVGVLTNVTALASAPQFGIDAGHTFASGQHPAQVALGDVNGDGKTDVVIANQTDNTVSLLLNSTPNGASVPTFLPQATCATAANPQSLTLADVNSDGKLDIVVGAYDATQLSVFVNTTAPGAASATFAARQDFTTGFTPIAVAAADLNGDGLLDMVSASPAINAIAVVLNSGTPGGAANFGTRHMFTVGTSPHAVAAADLNADGKPDVVSANAQSSNVSVLVNTTALGAATPTTTVGRRRRHER
jgi:hypothetical protein